MYDNAGLNTGTTKLIYYQGIVPVIILQTSAITTLRKNKPKVRSKTSEGIFSEDSKGL